jgi:hypothetical protein
MIDLTDKLLAYAARDAYKKQCTKAIRKSNILYICLLRYLKAGFACAEEKDR